jgi:hypothetical protein
VRFCDKPDWNAWTAVCLLAIALVYTNHLALLLVILIGIDYFLRRRAQPGTVSRLSVSAALLLVILAPLWPGLLRNLSSHLFVHRSLAARILNMGFNLYSFFVSESLAPWFWRYAAPAAVAVLACSILAFLSVKDAAKRFLVYAALLIMAIEIAGGIHPRQLMLVAPWILLPLTAALVDPAWPQLRSALIVSLLVAVGLGWFGVYARRYYAAPEFLEPWDQVAADASTGLQKDSAIIGNNPSFFFYLTYELRPGSPQNWHFAGILPADVHLDNIWSPEQWAAAGRPIVPRMLWVRGMPGPDEATPMATASDWLDHQCGDRTVRFQLHDQGYAAKQRFSPDARELVDWRIETHQYDCSQLAPSAPPAGSDGSTNAAPK